MSGVSDLFIELLEPLGPVRRRRMFGGAGFYLDEVIFALELEDGIYLKVDDSNRADFESAGSVPFVYDGQKGRTVVMPYWRLPEELYDDQDELIVWARKALAAGRLAKAKGGTAKKPRP